MTSGDQELPSAGLTADRNREAASKWRVKRKEVAGSRDHAPTKIVQSGRLSILAVAEDRKIPKPTNPHAHLTPPKRETDQASSARTTDEVGGRGSRTRDSSSDLAGDGEADGGGGGEVEEPRFDPSVRSGRRP